MNDTFTIIAASSIIFLLVRNSIVARKRNARVNKFMENMNNIDKKKQMKDLNDLIHGKKPSLLSNQEFEGFIEIYVDICYSGSRKGQAYMYALEQVRPEIYKDVVGCPSRDCFYEDKKILNLINYLTGNKWMN